MTFASWLDRRLHTDQARAFHEILTAAALATEPDTMSLLHWLTYIQSGHGLERIIAVTGGAQQDRVVGGSWRVSERLAEDLGEAVVTSAPVRRIAAGDDAVTVTADAGSFEAAQVIVATAPNLAGRIDYEPALPARRDLLTQQLPHGQVIKVMVAYDEPWWRSEGLNGQAASADGPVGVVFDNTVPGHDPGILVGFYEGSRRPLLGREDPHRPSPGLCRLPGPLLRPEGGEPGRLPRAGLGCRGVDPGLLRRPLPHRRLDPLRPRPPGTLRTDPLGGHRDGHPLDGLHRRRRPVRGASRQRGPHRPDVAGNHIGTSGRRRTRPKARTLSVTGR